MREDKFSAREVATLVEELKGEFRTVSEVVLPLREDMVEVKERLSSLETEVRSLKDAIRIEFPPIKGRLSALEIKAR